ncbi:hypothetical protein [Frigoriglobus tundricola]|nr:hypothetical protein [Frigoriglobus tundricola]
MNTRFFLVLAALVSATLPVAAAPPPAPREEVLRLAPPDFALVVVVQNLRDHIAAISDSPFAAWLPTTPLGKQFLGSADVKHFTDAANPLFGVLGISPADIVHDVVGDAVVFAYAPAPPGGRAGERSVILLRPRKPDVLQRLLDRLNTGQTSSKELKALVTRRHAGAPYSERQKADGSSEFYCFCGAAFAFSKSEDEIKAVLDRDKAARTDPPALVTRMTKLDVADAAVVVMVNPRPLDAELAAKVKSAKPEDRAFLSKFAAVWAGTEVAALYLSLDTGAELGVSFQFQPEKLPAGAKGWLVGERTPSAVWAAIPDDALFAAAGRVRATDVLDLIASVSPADDKKGVRETVEQVVGPVVGRDKLPLVLDAIGPDWGLWVTGPVKEPKHAVPVVTAAVKVRTGGPNDGGASRALLPALEYGFQTGRIAYNASHKDQLELGEETDGAAVIKALAGEAFPPGFRPCFALKSGYLVVSSSPTAIKAFRAPAADPKAGGDALLARFSSTAARGYLAARGPALATVLAATGAGEEQALVQQFDSLAMLLEPVEKLELIARGDPTGLKIALRLKATKPLKK